MVIKNIAGNAGREQDTMMTGRSKLYGKECVQIIGCLYCGKIYPVAATFFFIYMSKDMILTVRIE